MKNAKTMDPGTTDAVEPSRRAFLKRSGLFAGGAAVVSGTTLATLAAHTTWAQDGQGHDDKDRRSRASDYGDLHPTPDQNGDHILALPRGFKYVTFSKTGDPWAAAW